MVNPVSSAQDFGKQATQVAEQQQKQQTAKASKNLYGGDAQNTRPVGIPKGADGPQAASNPGATKSLPPAQPDAKQPKPNNTYSVDIKA